MMQTNTCIDGAKRVRTSLLICLWLLACAYCTAQASVNDGLWEKARVPITMVFSPYHDLNQKYPTPDAACLAIPARDEYWGGGWRYVQHPLYAERHTDFGWGCVFWEEMYDPSGNQVSAQEIHRQGTFSWSVYCPTGYVATDSRFCERTRPARDDSCPVGNPVKPGSGVNSSAKLTHPSS